MKKPQEDTFENQEEASNMEIPNISAEKMPLPLQEPQEVKSPLAVDAPALGHFSKAPDYDKYEHLDERFYQTAGLYQLVPDENGRPKVRFDGPTGSPETEDPEVSAEKCTADTSDVDREIEVLKEKKVLLEQRLRTSSSPEKIEELEKQLKSLESELQQKDNDTYRRQHTSFS